MLVLSLPALAWDELYQGDTPALDALLDDSAVAALSVRDVLPVTDAGDGYADRRAPGTRAAGRWPSGRCSSPTRTSSARRRRPCSVATPASPATSGLVAFGFPALVRRNDRLDYDAEIGALGEALAAAGVPRAVIANADGQGLLETAAFDPNGGQRTHRSARARCPAGAVSDALLEASPAAPFGVQLRPERGRQRPSRRPGPTAGWCWWRGPTSPAPTATCPWSRADHRPRACAARRCARTDALVARAARVRSTRRATPCWWWRPYHAEAAVHLTVAGMRGPGIEPGLLRSGSTRRAGLVTLVDIAPTILDLAGVERPDVDGGPALRAPSTGGAGHRRSSGPSTSTGIDQAARYRDRMVAPGRRHLRRPPGGALDRRGRGASGAARPAGRRAVALAALAMLGVPARDLPGGPDRLPRVAGHRLLGLRDRAGGRRSRSLATAIGGRTHARPAAAGASASCSACWSSTCSLGAPLQLNTVFGYSPTVGGRFAGMGNLAYGQFAGAAFLLCGLLSRRLAGRSIGTARGLRRARAWPSSSTACRSGARTSAASSPSSPPSG